jgi:hypothetical protein
MKKSEEMSAPFSCWNRARVTEMLFVLLERDKAAPATIRYWAKKRVSLGKNLPTDRQITEALECADYMEEINK